MTHGRAPLRAVVVGAGLMGRWHAHAVSRSGNRVAFVVDGDAGRAAALAARHRGARVLRSLDELTAGAADVAHCCTPLASHVAVASAALERGLHVLVEKPLAIDAASTEALLRLAESRGLLCAPVHQFPFQSALDAALREAAPALGPLLHVDFATCTAGAEGGDDAHRDAVAAEILPHPLSIVARLATLRMLPADALAPDVREWGVQRPAAGELRVAVEMGGASVALLVSTRGRPPVNRLRLVHERGTIEANLFHGFATVERGGTSRAWKLWLPFHAASRTIGRAASNLVRRAAARELAYPGLRELVGAFHAAAARGERDVPGLARADTLAIARMRDTIVDAAAVRAEVGTRTATATRIAR